MLNGEKILLIYIPIYRLFVCESLSIIFLWKSWDKSYLFHGNVGNKIVRGCCINNREIFPTIYFL